MTLEISFELSDTDLEYFRDKFHAARTKAPIDDPSSLLQAARAVMQKTSNRHPPDFVRSRLELLEQLVSMAEDDTWQLPGEDRRRILEMLAYVAEPADLISDDIPVLGLIDDVIAIELVLRAAQHELEAYREFSTFRSAEAQRRANAGRPTDVSKDDWLADRRAALHSRYRERRLADAAGWHNAMFS